MAIEKRFNQEQARDNGDKMGTHIYKMARNPTAVTVGFLPVSGSRRTGESSVPKFWIRAA